MLLLLLLFPVFFYADVTSWQAAARNAMDVHVCTRTNGMPFFLQLLHAHVASSHPIANAARNSAKQRRYILPVLSSFTWNPGLVITSYGNYVG